MDYISRRSKALRTSGTMDLWVVREHVSHCKIRLQIFALQEIFWEFTAQVTDDNRTAVIKDSGQTLDGCGANSGEILIIMEGTDFEDRTTVQIAEYPMPNTDTIHHELVLDPDTSRRSTILPFRWIWAPTNVILRFEENLPHEDIRPLNAKHLTHLGGIMCASSEQRPLSKKLCSSKSMDLV